MDVKIKKPLASLETVRDFIEVILPDYQWYIQHIKNSRDHLPTKVRLVLAGLKIEGYSKLYLDLPASNKLFSDLFLKNNVFDGEIKNFDSNEISHAGLLDQYINDLIHLSGDTFEFKDIDFETDDEYERVFLRDFLTWIMVWIHDLTALMVFGERITTLAPKAVAGDRTAIFKLVQIDPSTIRFIPQIAEQYQRAAIQKDKYFLKSFNHYLCNRVGISKLKHNLVYVPLFLLYHLQLLHTMSNKELLEFCDAAGLVNYEDIPDARTMGIIRKRFLEGVK